MSCGCDFGSGDDVKCGVVECGGGCVEDRGSASVMGAIIEVVMVVLVVMWVVVVVVVDMIVVWHRLWHRLL